MRRLGIPVISVISFLLSIVLTIVLSNTFSNVALAIVLAIMILVLWVVLLILFITAVILLIKHLMDKEKESFHIMYLLNVPLTFLFLLIDSIFLFLLLIGSSILISIFS